VGSDSSERKGTAPVGILEGGQVKYRGLRLPKRVGGPDGRVTKKRERTFGKIVLGKS